MNIQATTEGVESARKRMTEIGMRGGNRASGKAIRAGLKVMERAQKAAVPRESGLLRRSINSKFLRRNKQRKGMTTAMSGMNVGRKRPSKAQFADPNYKKTGRYAPHGHLVSLGSGPRWAGVKLGRKRGGEYDESKDRLTGKKVRWTGIMPANPAFRIASQAAEPTATAMVVRVLRDEIDNEIIRARGIS